jgi:hypothetical protein
MKTTARSATIAALSILTLTAMACTLSLLQVPTLPAAATQPPLPAFPTATVLPSAQTVFQVTLPEPLGSGESVALSLLDEVTGLSLNPQLYPMQALDNLTYTATLALPYNAVVRYRYVRLGSTQAPEDTTLNEPIRYRLYYVAGQAEVKDLIAGWSDRTYSSQSGSIEGRVLNIDTGTPIPDMLVTAAGERSFTDSAGRFDLQGLVPGTHNLVASATDGTYQVFQQGATVAQGLTTAVDVKLKASALVRVTFVVSTPNDVQGAPVRIAGNLAELGNTFADLQGGLNTVADRMPVMELRSDGRYSATISLPVGAYVQYKYTLGDGFWNAEHSAGGQFRLRDLIVPSQDVTIQDSVTTWQAGSSSPILFEVTVNSDTPAGDLIYIQFNPYGWTEPIPMWPLGNNRWAYKLYGPLNTLGNLHYRYCRDGQCGSADDLSTAGPTASGRTVETSLAGQDIKDTVDSWAWLQSTEPATLVGSAITARAAGFIGGLEFQSNYEPNWSYFNPQAVQNVQALGANWVFLTPSWTYGRASPLEFGLEPGQDPFWLDSAIMVSQARAANLKVGIFPVPHFATSAPDFWRAAPRDAGWWQDWFDHYRAFAVHYADLASQSGSQATVLGGDWLQPALPGGTLADGSASGVPADANTRWQSVISEVRQHFNGRVYWALPYAPGKLQASLNFLSNVDGIYLLWNAPLAAQANASKADMTIQAGQLLDNEVSPFASALNKPVILALAYPSADGAKTGCFSDGQGGCLDWSALNQPFDPGSVSVNLQAQSDMYEALLNALNERPWVAGIVSRGYYPPAMLQDKSASVHGKPAADLLWYWFPRLTGVVK